MGADHPARKRAKAIDKRVARRLRKLRKERGLSQGDLADALGVTWQQIQNFEHGRERMHAGKLVLLAGRLRVPVAALFAD